MREYLRSLNPQLPRPVWLLQVGGVMNSFGNGVVFPFLAIYLHNVRGFGIATAGIAIAISSVAQLLTGIAVGPIIDRVGARPVLASGLILQAAGFGLLPLVRTPWHAYALLAIEGIGSAGFWPSQSTLISKLTPAARLHAAFAQQRVTMNLGVGLGGLVGGLIATVSSPESFTVLFVLDGLTFLAYVRRAHASCPSRPRSRSNAARPRARTGRCCATGSSSGSGRSTSSSSPPAIR